LTITDLVALVVLTTASGALAPGPMFTANLIYGARYGARAGLLLSVGHTVVELPLVLLLGLGLLTLATQPIVESSVGVVGGSALIVFGVTQLKGSLKAEWGSGGREGVHRYGALAAGVIFTIFNPFFIVWWLSVGSKLVVEAILFSSLAGIALMFASHIWIDYLWLTFTAHLAKRGVSVIGSRGYRVVLAAFSLILIYFGYIFIASAVG